MAVDTQEALAIERDVRVSMQAEIERLRAVLTTIRDTLPERQDAYACFVFATAANALEPETAT